MCENCCCCCCSHQQQFHQPAVRPFTGSHGALLTAPVLAPQPSERFESLPPDPIANGHRGAGGGHTVGVNYLCAPALPGYTSCTYSGSFSRVASSNVRPFSASECSHGLPGAGSLTGACAISLRRQEASQDLDEDWEAWGADETRHGQVGPAIAFHGRQTSSGETLDVAVDFMCPQVSSRHAQSPRGNGHWPWVQQVLAC